MTSKQIPLSKPAWVGSLLFHFILFLVLLMLNFQQVRKPVSIERHAAGGILIKQKNDRDTSYIGEQGIEHIDQMPSKTEADILDGLVTQFTPLQPPERPGIGRKLIGSQSSDHASSEMSESFEFLAAAGVSDFGAEGIGGGSGKKRLRVFDVQAEGTKFIFVFDKSASMTERGGIPFNAAKAELLRNVNELDNEKNKFNIIFYNDEIHQWHENAMVDATKNNREDAIRFIKSEIARGGTKHLKP
ncbi:MAG: hypothetical protein LBQ66_04465, partial [Planctomycetaceae bacterium]|nr:hypothetical protein [Planctomycetaceae bacterium]